MTPKFKIGDRVTPNVGPEAGKTLVVKSYHLLSAGRASSWHYRTVRGAFLVYREDELTLCPDGLDRAIKKMEEQNEHGTN